MHVNDLWRTLFRVGVGAFWLYFASTKWTGLGWTRGLIEAAPGVNPIPGLHEFLAQIVAPNWFWFSLAQTIGETVVGFLLVLGLASRKAGVLGFLLALNLALVVAFEVHDLGFRWLYYLAVIANGELVFAEPGLLAMGRLKAVPAWLRE